MGSSATVLILGDRRKSDLIETLFNLGYVPLVREQLQQALEKLRHENFSAVLLDYRKADTDALEFILNVRDIDDGVPVIVVGEAQNNLERKLLLDQKNIFLVQVSSEKLEPRLKKLLNYDLKLDN